MPVVHRCSADGCETLTMGELCLDCERESELALAQAPARETVGEALGADPLEPAQPS